MASEAYANDYETSLNGSVTAARPVALTFRDAIPATLSGGNFRCRVDGEYLLVPAGGVSGLICTGCTTVEGSTAAPHADRAVVDQVLTRQGLLNSPGPMTTQGDITYLDSTLNPARLPLGTSSQVLTADGATGIPKWAAASGGGGSSTPLLNPYTARMHRNAAYTTTGGNVFTKLPFDTVDYDGDGDLVIASNRYVARVAGKYQVNAQLGLGSYNSVATVLAIYKNGSVYSEGSGGNAGIGEVTVSAQVPLAVGDYIEIFYSIGGAIAITAAFEQNYCDVALVPGTPAMAANTLVAKMYRSAAYTTAAATETKMPFDTVDFDPNGNVTIGSSQYTVPVSGKYLVDFQLYLNVSDRQIPHIRVNNVMKAKGDDVGGNGSQCVAILDLVAGDVVTAFYYTGGADAIVTGQNPAINRMEITFLAGTGATIWVPQGPVIIPGFAGSADIQPASPAAADDEFEATSAALPVTGWTNGTQAPSSGNVNTTAKSHLYLKSVAVNDTMGAIFKAAPATPFTMIAKISEHTLIGAVGHLGIFIADASPPVKAIVAQLVAAEASTATVLGGDLGTAASYTSIAASPTTGATDISTRKVPWAGGPAYLKMVVTAIGNVSIYMSYNGKLWIPIVVGYANAVGLAAASYVGLYVDASNNGPVSLEALFDWIRFS